MIKTNEIKSFWENNNDEYKNIKNKIHDIMDKNLNIQKD